MKKGNLSLTRRTGESIIIGDDIKIHVQRIEKGQRVRLVIQAPREVSVHRLEIYNLLKELA